jgi:CubicO group peptidase (beta-lactamase class C family)
MKQILIFTLLFYFVASFLQPPFLNEDEVLRETHKSLLSQKMSYSPTAVKQNEFNSTQLIQFIHRIMSCTRVPGMAVSVIKDGKVIFSEGFGYRNLETGAKVTPNTLFSIASTTKGNFI